MDAASAARLHPNDVLRVSRALEVHELSGRTMSEHHAEHGFRAVTLQSWPPERLAREVVRLNAESAQDELELLQLLYVDLEPGIQTTFLDAAGVQHEQGKIAEALEPPYASAAGVHRGATAVRDAHGEDGMLYLRTIARYSNEAWPDIDSVLAELGG